MPKECSTVIGRSSRERTHETCFLENAIGRDISNCEFLLFASSIKLRGSHEQKHDDGSHCMIHSTLLHTEDRGKNVRRRSSSGCDEKNRFHRSLSAFLIVVLRFRVIISVSQISSA